MATRTVKRRKRANRAARDSGAPVPGLEKAWRRQPICECTHDGWPCLDPATHRASVLCAEQDCANAVHVYLVCDACKDGWLAHARACSYSHKLRMTPL